MTREALLVTHTGRPDIVAHARAAAGRLGASGFAVRVLADEAKALELEGARIVDTDGAADGVEIVLVLGGDGTLLRAAELARSAGAPLLGVNLGRVGFLAETEPDAIEDTVRHVVEREYTVEERLTLDLTVTLEGRVLVDDAWALNEASVEKSSRERMLEVVMEVDGRPLSRFGCDGVVCATPTGSTAYAFSAGGPVVWPNVEALLLVPISAHALFARPLVTAPDAVLAVEVLPGGPDAAMFCDGRRSYTLPAGARVEARRGRLPVKVLRVHPRPFTDRLVAKFALPVRGWRGTAPG